MLTGVAIVGAVGLALGGGRPTPLGRTAGLADASSAAGASRASITPGPIGSATAAAVPDVPWLVQRPDGGWAYGHGGRTTPRLLPPDETGLAISEQWVASVLPDPAGRSTIRFRARDTGRAVADVVAPIWVSAGAWSSAGLVVTGYGDRSMTTDGGLVLVTPEPGRTTVLVGAGPFDPKLGHPVARGDVVVSPSRRLVGANACGIRLCDAQVVDVGSGTVFRPVGAAEGFLRVLTDEAVVTTDADGRWISARRVTDGMEVWRQGDRILLEPVATADGAVVAVTGSRRTGGRVVAIDATGATRELGLRSTGGQAWPHVWAALSNGSSIVVAGQPFGEWVGSGRSLPVTVVGLSGGGRGGSSTISLRLPSEMEWSR